MPRKSSIIFWTHFAVALVGHAFLIIMPIGLFKMLWSTYLDFWTKGLFLGTLYLGLIYIVNHIAAGESGFCVLTSLENACRKSEGLPLASKRFVPRFYSKCYDIYKWVLRKK